MSALGRLKKFINDSRHVLSISYKPKEQEFRKSIRIILIGIAIIGILGFIISIVISLFVTGALPAI